MSNSEYIESSERKCPICFRNNKKGFIKSPAFHGKPSGWGYGSILNILVECEYCGEFQCASRSFTDFPKNHFNKRLEISHLLYQMPELRKNGIVFLFDTLDNLDFFNSQNIQGESIIELQSKAESLIAPKNVIEMKSFLLKMILQYAPRPNMFTKAHSIAEWTCLLLLEHPAELEFIIEFLNSMIGISLGDGPAMKVPFQRLNGDFKNETLIRFILTYQGWEHVLSEINKIESDIAFVAMWFNENVKAIRDPIKRSLEDCGFTPVIIDETEYEKRVDASIVSYISKAALVIIDVTGDRSGVYYEAGLAEGKNIPTIWMCQDDKKWVNKMHFDTRQYNHILWKDPEEIEYKLSERIVLRRLNKKEPVRLLKYQLSNKNGFQKIEESA
jgi:nucleoside 2-deoxyribosyltransferase